MVKQLLSYQVYSWSSLPFYINYYDRDRGSETEEEYTVCMKRVEKNLVTI